MPPVSESALWIWIFRSSMVFAVALILSSLFRTRYAVARAAWLIAFLFALVALIPIPAVSLPILGEVRHPANPMARVYELDPRFSQLSPTVLSDIGQSWVVTAFAVATVLGLLVWVARWVQTLRMVRAADQIVEERLIDLLYELGQQQGLSDVPVLKRSDQIQSPCVWGITQPTILVPTGFDETLDIQDWRLALEHEVMHLGQRDTLRLAFFSAVQHLLWWNPLVLLGFKRAMLVQEMRIDSKIASAGTAPAYASLLLRSASLTAAGHPLRLLGQGHLIIRMGALNSALPARTKATSWLALAGFLPFVVPIRFDPPYVPDPLQIGFDEIVYESNTESTQLWRMAQDGRGAHPMSKALWGGLTPSVSPDGRWLAYSRMGKRREDIYVARLDGSEERLIVGSEGRDYEPRWSPDGTKLTFCTTASGHWQIGVADVNSASWKLVTSGDAENLEPDWHPNGQRIVFSQQSNGRQNLWSINVDGTQPVAITTNEVTATGGHYSPDGKYLVYASTTRFKYDLWLLDLATRQVRPLTMLGQGDASEATFSQDGRFVFAQVRDESAPSLVRIDLRSGEQKRFASDRILQWPVLRGY